MDLTDEQWKVLEPLIGEMPQRADKRVRQINAHQERLNFTMLTSFLAHEPVIDDADRQLSKLEDWRDSTCRANRTPPPPIKSLPQSEV